MHSTSVIFGAKLVYFAKMTKKDAQKGHNFLLFCIKSLILQLISVLFSWKSHRNKVKKEIITIKYTKRWKEHSNLTIVREWTSMVSVFACQPQTDVRYLQTVVRKVAKSCLFPANTTENDSTFRWIIQGCNVIALRPCMFLLKSRDKNI